MKYSKIEKIVIRMPNCIGDSIMTFSAIELLKKAYPDASFTIVCRPFISSLFNRLNTKNKVITIDEKVAISKRIIRSCKLIKKLRKETHDLGILFQNTFLNAFILRLAKVKKIIGYDKEMRKFLLDFSLPYDKKSHYVNRYAHLVNAYLGNKYKYLPRIDLYPQQIGKINFNNKNPKIGVFFGTDNKDNDIIRRVIPKDISIEITKLIAKKKWNIVFFGAQADNVKHSECIKHFKKFSENVINLTGKTNITELIDGIASVDVMITIDSAAMHIAAYTNTPFVALIGKGSSPFDYVKPKSGRAVYLKNENRLIDERKYIEQIDPYEVIDSVQQLLEEKIK